MNLKEMRAAALKAAQDIIDGAKSSGRELSEEETATVDAKFAEIEELDGKIKSAKESQDRFDRIASLSGEKQADEDTAPVAKTLGEHFVKSIGDRGVDRLKNITGASVAAPEFVPAKAAGDTHAVGQVFAPWLTEFDRTVVREFRRPTITDLLGSGTLGPNSNAVTYLVEGGVEGGFGVVAEGGAKPQFHIGDPTTRTDALKKIAGFLKFTDEMVEDLDFWVSEINQRGLYLLSLAEENQLLNGSGTGNNVLGVLNRSGIQTEAAADADDLADAIFRASTKIQTATGLAADGVAIHPLDYQGLRLRKDGNGQYFGGGFFSGQYGNGGVLQNPPVWGLPTVVTPAVPQGSPVVGAFKAATSVYRKGGVRVESTNSHVDDFTNNLITTRIEERVALAVRVPAAIVKVSVA